MLLQEFFDAGLQEAHIDEQNGVIHNVKLLGRASKNNRTYSDRAMESAAKHYNGIQVNLDHPEMHKAKSERKFVEGIGIIENPRKIGDEVRGDFHYLTSHPYGPSIAESARRFPSRVGFSHNAEGDTRVQNGATIVEDVTQVRSLDIVTRPATTKGLFESEEGTVSAREAMLSLPEEYHGLINLFPSTDPQIVFSPSESDNETAKKILQEVLQEEINSANLVETSKILTEASEMPKTIEQILEGLLEDYDLDNLTDEDLENMSPEELEALDAVLDDDEDDEEDEYDEDDEDDEDEFAQNEEELQNLATQVESALESIDHRCQVLEKRELLQDLLEEEGLHLNREERASILEAESVEEMLDLVRSIPRTASRYRINQARPVMESVIGDEDDFPQNGKEFAKALA